ncbi:hypothetical protein Btru_014385 [Bulinus truncatus]|nr:hypothetical protein Btru_014385 [Bulinus truncatus]
MQNSEDIIKESKFEDHWLYVDVTVSILLSVCTEFLGQYLDRHNDYPETSQYQYVKLVNSFILGNLLGVLRHGWFQLLNYNVYETNITSLLMKVALDLCVAAYFFRYVEFAVTRLLESRSVVTIYRDWDPYHLPKPDPPLLYVLTFFSFKYLPDEYHAVFSSVFDFGHKVSLIFEPVDFYSYTSSNRVSGLQTPRNYED